MDLTLLVVRAGRSRGGEVADAAERFDRMGGLVAGVGNDMRSRAAKRAFRA